MLNFFFPKFCLVCSRVLLKEEELLCLHCVSDLPLTNFHKYEENIVLNLFYGLLPVCQATSLLHFTKKGITQNLLHQLKYKSQQKIGAYFGKWLGWELKQIARYKDIEAVIAVPLHKKRLRTRGYNQVANFAKQISLQLQVPYYEGILIKAVNVRSQVGLDRWDRINSKLIFEISDAKTCQVVLNKHVLLVDDLITTGSTIIECGNALLKVPIRKLSVASLAIG